MHTLSSFPLIDNDLLQKIRVQTSPFEFSYTDGDGDIHDLVAEDSTSSAHPLSDEHGKWSPDSFGFNMTRNYNIRCASFLFGAGGVACKDAVLSLAIIWKSPDSRQRSAFEIGAIANQLTPQIFTLVKPFPYPQFRGRLTLQTAVIIKKAGNPGPDETHLANLPGTVLGILDTYTILFDGKGSAFPVAITNNPGGLLWSVDCDFDDPTTDRFNDCVSINLNSAHKDYKYINPSDKAFNPAFMREVLAGAISTIVDCVRETDFWDDIRNGNVEEESVGQAIYYFSKTLDLNLEDARQCSISFREYFEQKLGEL